jgi:branched-chain amino acid transport system substrate-binding protein
VRIHSVISLVAAAVLLATLPVPLRAQAPAPVVIPVLISLTGAASFIGKSDQQSLELIEKLVNKQGGINHRPLHFEYLDDGTNPQTVVQLANQVIASKAPIVIGPTLTQQCLAVAPLFQANGPADYCLSPAINPPAGGYIWSTSISAKDLNDVAVRYLRERGLKRLAILSSTDATGQEADRDWAHAKTLPENRDVEFVAQEHFGLTDVSIGAQMARIKAANPQALLTFSVGSGFGTELHGIVDSGLEVPVYASNGDMIVEQLSGYKGFMPKELLFSAVLAFDRGGLANGPVKDAINVFYGAFKEAGLVPNFPNTLSWDPAMIILDAYRHLGNNATAAQFREYINALHGYAGINGIYDFRDGTQHGISENGVVMVRYNPANDTFAGVSKRSGHLK